MRSGFSTFMLIAGAALGVAAISRTSGGGADERSATVTDASVQPAHPAPTPAEPRRRVRRRWPVVAVVAAGVIGAGVAVAAWNVTGSGSGYAKAGTATGLTIGDASASTVADLYPGVTGAAKLRITNPNGFAVRVTTVTRTGAITSDAGAACDAATGVSFTDQTGLTLDLAAGATQTFTLAGSVAMSNASDNSCQGALFTIPVSVSGVSN